MGFDVNFDLRARLSRREGHENARLGVSSLWVSGVSGFVALVCLLCFGVSLVGTARRVIARHSPLTGGR